MVQVIDNKVVKIRLPKTGILRDGSTVSGYHLLDESILRDEGWLPLEKDIPDYDPNTQFKVFDRYEIMADKVIAIYRVEDIVESIDRVAELEKIIDALIGGDSIE